MTIHEVLSDSDLKNECPDDPPHSHSDKETFLRCTQCFSLWCENRPVGDMLARTVHDLHPADETWRFVNTILQSIEECPIRKNGHNPAHEEGLRGRLGYRPAQVPSSTNSQYEPSEEGFVR